MLFLSRQRFAALLLAVSAAAAVAVYAIVGVGFTSKTKIVTRSARGRVETVYIKNLSPRYMSNGQIRHDIPSWEKAANKDFAPVWGTPQVRIVLLSKKQTAPRGSIVATFVKNGPVQGALAYHEVQNGVPAIVVYTGVGDFFGYNNSVSFTHELFETLGDPTISQTNQGYPYPQFCLDSVGCVAMMPGTVWANEVSDAVEEFSYRIHGVEISDFITPNWFNDHYGRGFDYMNYLSEPFEIAPGGYSCFLTGSSWNCVTNFRHASRDASGFYKGEHVAGLHR